MTITREQTKQLVRKLPKQLNDEEYTIAYHQQLHATRNKKEFFWVNKMFKQAIPEGAIGLPIRMQELYEKGEDWQYKRRLLGVLDNYVYEKVNTVSRQERKQKVEPEDVVGKVNNSMNHLRIFIDEYDGASKFNVIYTNEEGSKQPKRQGFQNLTGEGMAVKFEQYIRERYNGQLKTEYNNSENTMSVDITVLEMGKRRLVVNLIRSFDRYLG